jgi:3-phosphoshikimate 1-carboxyvinyltransferase
MKFIKPAEISGTIQAPPSKSMMIRAAAAGFLSPSGCSILNPSFCEDALASLDVIQSLGASVKHLKDQIRISGRPESPEQRRLNCRESGLCIRLFAPIAALYPGPFQLTGNGTLLTRPMREMESIFENAGAACRTDNGTPPITLTGSLHGGDIQIKGQSGSQVLSGLLMALPLCPQDSRIRVDKPVSLPYIRMTLSVLSDFNIRVHHSDDLTYFEIPGRQTYRRRTFLVGGDWSGASFWLAAAAVKGSITVMGLNQASFQADRSILTAVRSTGADISAASGSIRVRAGSRKPFTFDATHCPDLFPPLAVLACSCRGRSIIKGIHRLIHKESNRARTLQTEFNRIGGDISIKGDTMVINGSHLSGGIVSSHQDHRIAMAGAAAGLLSQQGVGIRNWQAVRKSYPNFFHDLKHVGERAQ